MPVLSDSTSITLSLNGIEAIGMPAEQLDESVRQMLEPVAPEASLRMMSWF